MPDANGILTRRGEAPGLLTSNVALDHDWNEGKTLDDLIILVSQCFPLGSYFPPLITNHLLATKTNRMNAISDDNIT